MSDWPTAREWSRAGEWVRREGWRDHSRWIRHEAGPGSARAVVVHRDRTVTDLRAARAAEFTEVEFRALDWTRTAPPFDPPEISLEVLILPDTTIDLVSEFPLRTDVAAFELYGAKAFGPWEYPIRLVQRAGSASWFDLGIHLAQQAPRCSVYS